MSNETVEAIRASYRPKPIATLFVGESAPASGKFFYFGNTGMTTYMKQAVDAAFGPSNRNFLQRFKSFCWYLDDLVLTPVNGLNRRERRAACLAAQASLADRIKEYQPRAIVTLMLGIKDIVDAAAISAGSSVKPNAVHFPGNGQQRFFLKDMVHITPSLPRCPLADYED